MKQIQNFTMDQIHEEMAKFGKDDLILDVRTPEEFQEAHIQGSTNIPHDEVSDHLNELKPYKRIIIFCRSGGRAKAAAGTLVAMGLQNIHCVSSGGMPDWIASGYPVVEG